MRYDRYADGGVHTGTDTILVKIDTVGHTYIHTHTYTYAQIYFKVPEL